jgi:hypothetical protein
MDCTGSAEEPGEGGGFSHAPAGDNDGKARCGERPRDALAEIAVAAQDERPGHRVPPPVRLPLVSELSVATLIAPPRAAPTNPPPAAWQGASRRRQGRGGRALAGDGVPAAPAAVGAAQVLPAGASGLPDRPAAVPGRGCIATAGAADEPLARLGLHRRPPAAGPCTPAGPPATGVRHRISDRRAPRAGPRRGWPSRRWRT